MNHDEFMLKLEENSKKKNFRNWLNNVFPNGFAGYNAFYILTHPWKIIEHCRYEVKYAWQRVVRGWDDTAPWSIDWYLAEQIPQLVEALKKHSMGIPTTILAEFTPIDNNYNYSDDDIKKAEEKWKAILDKIILGFESYPKLHYLYPGEEGYEEHLFNFDLGFQLLKEYFEDLWY